MHGFVSNIFEDQYIRFGLSCGPQMEVVPGARDLCKSDSEDVLHIKIKKNTLKSAPILQALCIWVVS